MERDSFETLGDMEVTGGRIGWLAAGPVEALVRTGGAQGVQSRMRQMFLAFLRNETGEAAPDCMVCSNSRRDFYTGIRAARMSDLCRRERTVYMGYYDVQMDPAAPRLLWWNAVPAQKLRSMEGVQRNGDRCLIRISEGVMAESWRAAAEGQS